MCPHPDHRGAHRASLAISAALVVFAVTHPVGDAAAQPGGQSSGVKACTSLAEDGQRLRAAGRLIDAREKLIACSSPECPQVVRADCAQWASEILAATPSIVVDVKDGTGVDVADAKVFVDGRPVADRIDGRPINVDPGEHDVRVDRSDGMSGSQKIVAKENAKARDVKFVLGGRSALAPPEPPPPRVEASTGGWGAMHYGGVALIAVGGIAITYALVSFFTYSTAESDLRTKFDEAEQSAKGCPSSSATSDPQSTCGKNVATREKLRAEYNQNEQDGKAEQPFVLAAAIGGTLLVAGGIVMLVLAPSTKASPASTSASVRGGPVITPHFGGMTLGGTF